MTKLLGQAVVVGAEVRRVQDSDIQQHATNAESGASSFDAYRAIVSHSISIRLATSLRDGNPTSFVCAPEPWPSLSWMRETVCPGTSFISARLTARCIQG